MPEPICFILLGVVCAPVCVGAVVSCKYMCCEMPACCDGTWDREKWNSKGGGCTSCHAFLKECFTDLDNMAEVSKNAERAVKIRAIGGTPPSQQMVYTCKGSGKTVAHRAYVTGRV